MPLFGKFGKRDKSSATLHEPTNAVGRSGSNASTSAPSNSTHLMEDEYVLPDYNVPADENGVMYYHRPTSPTSHVLQKSPQRNETYSNPAANGSSHRLNFTMPGFKRKQTGPSNIDLTSPRGSMTSSRRSAEKDPASPTRASVFGTFGNAKSYSSASLPSSKSQTIPPQLPPIRSPSPLQPRQRPPPVTSQTLPMPKAPEMRTSSTVKIFNWGSKPSKMSDAPKLDLKIPSSTEALDSFSLKSFRPVRPISPAPPPMDIKEALARPPSRGLLDQPIASSPSHSSIGGGALAPPSPINEYGSRSRGASIGSNNAGVEGSPRMTVAQFRQAQMESAKNRSSVHLPVPEHPSDGMPPGNVPLHLARPVSPNPGYPLGVEGRNSPVPSPFAGMEGRNSPNPPPWMETGRGSPVLRGGTPVGGGGNDSAGEGTPSRPARLLPPQAMGRSSPVPRGINGSPSPRGRVQQNNVSEGSRMSAKWMVSSSSETESSEGDDTASEGEKSTKTNRTAGRPARGAPLIPDFQNQKGPDLHREREPAPSIVTTSTSKTADTARSSAYPSSFASSRSKSDLGHGMSSRPSQQTIDTNTANGLSAPPRKISGAAGYSPASSSRNIRPGEYSPNIRPGEYSTPSPGAASNGSVQDRSESVLTHKTSQSMDVWSNTHSAAHSRQGSGDGQQFSSSFKGAKSDLGHSSPMSRNTAVRRQGESASSSSSTTAKEKASVTRSRSTNALGLQSAPSNLTSSFARSNPRTAPVPTESEADDESEEEEDDAPLSSLVPPRKIGSGSVASSPAGSMRNLALREQSPARGTASGRGSTSPNIAATDSPRMGGAPPPNFTRPTGSTNSRQGSMNATTAPVPIQDDASKRGRKPLLDIFSSSPNSGTISPVEPSQQQQHTRLSSIGEGQGSLLTPPISEQDSSKPSSRNGSKPSSFINAAKSSSSSSTSSPSTAKPPMPNSSSGSLPVAAGPPGFLRPGSIPIHHKSHELLSRPLLREDSPASSIGSSARFPATPKTGSDASASVRLGGSNSVITSSSGSSSKNDGRRLSNDGRRHSVTFDDTPQYAPSGDGTVKGVLKRTAQPEKSSGHVRHGSWDEQEAKRNERRRSEAKNAVELGRVVNGPTLIDSDEDAGDKLSARSHSPTQQWNVWQAMQMQQMQAMAMGMNPSTPLSGVPPFNMNGMGTPTSFNPLMQMNMNNMMNNASPQMFNPMMSGGFSMPQGFQLPPIPQIPNMMMGMDPNMMAAHQQAMMMAKQAYQMAVAQQAIAAAGEEWERSSNMGGFSGTSSRPPTLFGMSGGNIFGNGGSMLGVPTMGNGSLWGGSVFGDAFGPSLQQSGGQGGVAFPSSATDIGDHARGTRKRTMTAPSSALPPAHLRGAGAPPLPPPSSWRPS